MHRMWRIQILGKMCAFGDSHTITRFRTERVRALLAYLAYYPHRAHPREVLIDLLWPDYELPAGRNCLSIELSFLRHQLEPPGTSRGTVIQADNTSVHLNSSVFITDVAEFEAALQSAEAAGSKAEQAQYLAGAVDLYSGPLLPGCYLPGCYENWIKPEQQRLNEAYIQALRRLVRLEARFKRIPLALDYARRAVNADPLREETHRDLIWLYAVTGQPAAALQQYQELEQLLWQEFGDKPARSTRDLVQKIKNSLDLTEPPDIAPVVRLLPPSVSAPLPSGTVTFLLIAIENPTCSSQPEEQEFQSAVDNLRILLRKTYRQFNGCEALSATDSLLMAFAGVADALDCAVKTYQEAVSRNLPEGTLSLQVRMALHTGEVKPHEGYYSGPLLDHGYRLLGAARGGQVLCSEATAAVLPQAMQPDRQFVYLGRYRLSESSTAERLFRIEFPGMTPPTSAPPNALPAETGNLPLQLTRFFGRDHEQLRLQHLLLGEQKRLLTITGPGGIGKTRLALEAAGGLMDAFRGAVWFVPLITLSNAQDILDAIHRALRLDHSNAVTLQEEIVEVLQRQPSLLVLDNFEHLVTEGAATVRTLLERAPSLLCLVTSRQRLNLTGEHELPIQPLPVPQPTDPPEQQMNFASVQLFIDRAQAVRPGFQVTDANAAAVAGLCQRLEGIPLAIELAASRMQTTTVGDILAQLEHRLDYLVNRRRDAVDRHRSLRAVIDWSYRLLAPELQQFFKKLTVFCEGWTVEAAEAVCNEPLAMDFLAQLRECSQVTAEESEGKMRFFLLDTIREFVREQRGDEDYGAVASRHANYYLRLTEEAEPHLLGQEAILWFDRLDREHHNILAALEWCIETEEAETALKLAGIIWRLWYVRGYHREGLDWLERVLAIQKDASPLLRIRALNGAGVIAYEGADYSMARTFFEQSLALSRAIDDPSHIATALGNLANIARDIGDYSQARLLYEECLSLFRVRNHRRGITLVLGNLANLAYNQQDYVRACALHQESLERFRESEDRQNVALGLNNLAHTRLSMEDLASIPALLEESQGLSMALENRRLFAHSLTLWVALALKVDDIERAAILLGAEERLRAQFDFEPSPQAMAEIERHHETVRAVLGEQAFAIARNQGGAMSLEQTAAFTSGRLSLTSDTSKPKFNL